MHLQGVPIAVIAAWLGHVDRAFTMRTYMHSQNAELFAAAKTLAGQDGFFVVVLAGFEPATSRV